MFAFASDWLGVFALAIDSALVGDDAPTAFALLVEPTLDASEEVEPGPLEALLAAADPPAAEADPPDEEPAEEDAPTSDMTAST